MSFGIVRTGDSADRRSPFGVLGGGGNTSYCINTYTADGIHVVSQIFHRGLKMKLDFREVRNRSARLVLSALIIGWIVLAVAIPLTALVWLFRYLGLIGG